MIETLALSEIIQPEKETKGSGKENNPDNELKIIQSKSNSLLPKIQNNGNDNQ
jgi:hypothetical protein